ncbi:MAG: PA0069 family radical SAM protein [Proteobacteria bacterium]|nr:PA0069 family radical SAM protein [Pseudomonadota bacterium]
MSTSPLTPAYKGRGSAENPTSRFERLTTHVEPQDLDNHGQPDAPETVYLRDPSRSIVAFNTSPDVGFNASVNPYRGCEHGCIYCYARPTHEYLGFSAGLDFESRILVKEEAPALLRRELSSRRWKPQVVGLSGVTDCYQPIERRLGLTRRCLEVFLDFRNPVTLITKSALVTRDVDRLAALAERDLVSVSLSITTLDGELHRRLEPRASHPLQRLRAIEVLADAGVPVGVNVAPVIPGLNDHEIPAICKAAAKAGARFGGRILLRLPYGVKDLFEQWLERHYPARRKKVLSRLRGMRGGQLNDSAFGSRMRGDGFFADHLARLFALSARKAGLGEHPALRTDAFRAPGDAQLGLFAPTSRQR